MTERDSQRRPAIPVAASLSDPDVLSPDDSNI